MPERMAAFGLVYDKYIAKGMISPNPYCMRITDFHLLPTTTIFVAVQDERVVATVTLIGDGPLGLPMDTIHPEITQAVRDRGLFVGEVSCLAFENHEPKFFLPVFVELTRLMTQFARANGMHQLLIGCIPQHANFYCRYLGFERVGEVRPYPTVCGTLGVACCLDFARIDRDRPECYDKYFGVRLPEAELRSTTIAEGERSTYAHVVSRTEPCLLRMA